MNLALAEMYVQGVSTRKMIEVLQKLVGPDISISSTQISRCSAALDEALEAWRTRPLGETPYLILDARYERLRYGGQVIDCAVLVALGVTATGHRRVLGVSVSLSEAEVHWRDFMQSLVKRGLTGIQYIVSDDHAGLRAARRSVFLSVALAEDNLPEGFAVFALPMAHRVRMRTTNGLERLNKEIKRRTRVACLFPNPESCLRLVSALLAEQDDEWMSAKIYLAMPQKTNTAL